jgi:FkbM family methyltransferase
MNLIDNITKIVKSWNLSNSSGNSLHNILNSNCKDISTVETLQKSLSSLNERINFIEKSISSKIKLNNIDFKCISLNERKDRRDWINSHLPNFNIKYDFFDAIVDNNEYNINFPKSYNKGQKGCFLSHYKLLKTHNSDKILGIFEDDVILCEDFLERFKYIEDNFDLEWDIFFLSSYYHLNEHKDRWNDSGDFELTNIKYIHRVYGAFTTHSYLVNPKSINKILNLIDENIHDTYAIDHVYCAKIESKLNCYSFTPGMANQKVSYSDVDNTKKDPNIFKSIIGDHYYVDNLKDFDYDKYFEKYITERKSNQIENEKIEEIEMFNYNEYYNKIGDKISTKINRYEFRSKKNIDYVIYNYDYFTKWYHQNNNGINEEIIEYSKLLDSVSVLDKSRAVVDIGSNCGLFSIPTSLLGYQVYGFEPTRMNLRLLELGKEENNCNNFNIISKAVSNETKKETIYIPYCSDNTSFNKDIAISNMVHNKNYIEEIVDCITFDDWISQNKDINVGFIKIDVQGFEKEVLDGMINFLNDCHDTYIYLEWDKKLTTSNGYTLNELDSILKNNHFNMVGDFGNDKLFYKN